MAENGADDATTMYIACHSHTGVHDVYIQDSQEKVKAAIELIPRIEFGNVAPVDFARELSQIDQDQLINDILGNCKPTFLKTMLSRLKNPKQAVPTGYKLMGA